MILGEDLRIRKMNCNDLDLLFKWLNDPRVLEFYEETPQSIEQVIEKYGPRVEGKDYVFPCIVEYKNKAIGYIQYYEIPKMELKAYSYVVKKNIYGIDQFIGEPDLWGKGIGTSMISVMLDFLYKEKNASIILLEVKANNLRAISCYKKCGFKEIKELKNNFILMEWNKEKGR